MIESCMIGGDRCSGAAVSDSLCCSGGQHVLRRRQGSVSAFAMLVMLIVMIMVVVSFSLPASQRAFADDGLVAGSVDWEPDALAVVFVDSSLAKSTGVTVDDDAAASAFGSRSHAEELIHQRLLTDAVFPFFPNPTTEAFIVSIAEPAREIGQKDGLYASVMIAQAILESGSGSSGLSKPPYNNLFGIKGSYKGASVTLMTSEDDGTGHEYAIAAAFRRYPSVKASLQDYADLLKRDMGSFYAPAWKANARTYAKACDYLQGRYATDTTYAGKLKGIILAYNLTEYDHPKPKSDDEARTEGKADDARSVKARSLLRALVRNGSSVAAVSPVRLEMVEQESDNEKLVSESVRIDELTVGSSENASESESAPEPFPVVPGVPIAVASLATVVALLAKSKGAVLLAAIKTHMGLSFIFH